MKNPFERNDHKVLIAGIIIGSIAAGTAALLFLTETGDSVRKQIAGQFNLLRGALTGDNPGDAVDHSKDYLQHHTKKPKTDREALLKHEIIGTRQSDHQDDQPAQA